VIQFDEPAFNVYMDEVAAWGVAALEAAAAGLKCKTAVAHLLWLWNQGEHRLEEDPRFRVAAIRVHFPLLARSTIAQVSLECANSHVPLELLALLKGKDVLVAPSTSRTTRREARASRGDDPLGNEIRAAGEALSLHQLRHGAARARGRARQIEGPRRGGRARAPGTRCLECLPRAWLRVALPS